ncbi:unnamed protein product [Closterium sp. NIES-65]|nr:unnamed protein product [Closterium sp. NIES-65]
MRHYRWALLAIPLAPTLILSAPRAHAVMASASGPSPSTSAVADPSKFGYRSTAEDVTAGVDLSGKVAIVMALANSPSRANLVLVPMFSPRAHVAPLSFRRANFFFLPLSRHPSGANFLPPGGSSGIGTETARVLALRGASVVLAVRNTEAGEAAKAAIIKDIEGRSAAAAGVPAAVRERVSVMPLDLASLKSVRAFAADYLRPNRPLHLLMYARRWKCNNAGVMICPFMLTADGHENQFGTNHVGECREATTWVSAGEQQPRGLIAPHLHCLPLPLSSVPSAPPPPLFPSIPFPPSSAHIPHPIASHVVPPLGHFLLTNLLLPKLKETAKQEGAEARIVIVSSAAYQFPYPGGIRFDAIMLRRGMTVIALYPGEEGAGVTVNALHPGVIDTNPSRHIVPPGTIWHTLGRMVFQPGVPVGAATSCFLAAHPSVAGASGGYYADSRAAEGKATALSKDMELAGKLWELSEQVASKQ